MVCLQSFSDTPVSLEHNMVFMSFKRYLDINSNLNIDIDFY